jgi:hypothetical protein
MRVYQYLVLATMHFLVPVEAYSFSAVATLDAMGVNNQGAGGGFTPLFFARPDSGNVLAFPADPFLTSAESDGTPPSRGDMRLLAGYASYSPRGSYTSIH